MSNSCVLNDNATAVINKGVVTLLGTLSGVSLLTCLVALAGLFYLNLHKQFVYRLASYQVFGSFLHALSGTSQLLFIYLSTVSSIQTTCLVVGSVGQLALWLKLSFTGLVTVHLFCFAVFFRNLKKLEPTYVIVSTMLALIFTIIPFITGSYGVGGGWCWIDSRRRGCVYQTGYVEQFVLYYGPAFAALPLEAALMVSTLVIVHCRSRRKTDDEAAFGREQNKKAFQQLLPLVAYPIAFCILIVPPLVNRVYLAAGGTPSEGLQVVAVVCIVGWSFTSAMTLIVHMVVVSLSKTKVQNCAKDRDYRSLPLKSTSVANEETTAAFDHA